MIGLYFWAYVATLEDGSYFFDKLRKSISVVSVCLFCEGMLARLIDFPCV
jgi:hypothetical protein